MLCSFAGRSASFPGELRDISPQSLEVVLTGLIVASQLKCQETVRSPKTCSEVLSISASELNSSKHFMLGAVEKPFGVVPCSFPSHLGKQN